MVRQIIGVVLLLSGLHLGLTNTATAAEQSQPDAYELSGEPFYFNLHHKKNQEWVIIHYWAHWCKGCVREIPLINKFVQKHPEVVFRAIHLDNPSQHKLTDLKRKLHIQFPVVYDVNATDIPNPNDIKSIPATFVYNPKSNDYQVFYGPVDMADLEKAISGKHPHHRTR